MHGNVGTIIRSAGAFNIPNIICISGTTDVYSPKVIRSTMGSILKENIIYIDEDLQETLINKLKQNDYYIYATTLDGNCNIETIYYNTKCAFILGNESNGVSSFLQENSDEKIKIDMDKNTDSLNVSVAAGILMYKNYIKKNKKSE